MKRIAPVLGTLLVLAQPARAQDSTVAVLRRARQFYEALNVERALPLLHQVLSPAWPFEVSIAQRAEAYKYLGAALVLVGKSDSAELVFQAGLARDPFTDLTPLEFTPAQIAAFNAARRRRFAVATRPVTAARVDPRLQRIRFTLVTTHAAELRAVIRPADGRAAFPVFGGESDGVREISWDGLTAARVLTPPGRYELLVTGRSRLLPSADSARAFFELAHEVRLLEDTLPAVAAGALLPERQPGGRSAAELAKGVGVAAGVLLVSRGLAHQDLGSGQGAAVAAVAVAGVAAGAVALLTQSRRRGIPANIEVNRRREEERRATNEAIRRRNAEKIAHPILVITPAAGVVR